MSYAPNCNSCGEQMRKAELGGMGCGEPLIIIGLMCTVIGMIFIPFLPKRRKVWRCPRCKCVLDRG